MTTADADLAQPFKSASCGNCGRPYGPGDGIRFFQYSSTSVLGLRRLFADQLRTVTCPGCDAPITFEPGIFVVGIDPPTAYVLGGDALSGDQVAGVIRGVEKQAASEGRQIDVRRFDRQDDLRVALFERLRSSAKAMTPLNAANVKGELAEFLAAHWRTITPEVLVASDVVTMVQHVLTAPSDDAHEKGVAYFTTHAAALGQIQAMTWLNLCAARGWHARPVGSSLERDFATFIDPGVIFEGTVPRFENHVKDYQRTEDRDSLVQYCMLAVLARARKARGEPNSLDGDWSHAWMALELALRGNHPEEVVSRLEPLALSREAIAGTLRRKTLFDIAGQTLAPYLDGRNPQEATRVATALEQIGEQSGYDELAGDLFRRGIVVTLPGIKTAAQAIEQLDRMRQHVADGKVSLEVTVDLLCGEMIAAHDVEGVKAVFEHALPHAGDDATRASLESWYGATLLRLHRESLLLDQVGADEREWEARLPNGTKGRLWTERANALRATGRFQETLEWRRRVVPMYAEQPESANHRQATRALATAERETGAPDRALGLILPLLQDREALDRINMLDTASAIWTALGERAKALTATKEAVQLAVGPHAHLRQHFETSLASLQTDSTATEIERGLLDSSRDGWKSPLTLLQECAAWLNLQARDHELSADGAARCADAVTALSALLKDGVMPPQLRETGYIVLAKVGERYGFDQVERSWEAAADAADALGLVPHPEVVMRLAEYQYRSGSVADARAVLRALPSALARSVEHVQRLDVALDALTNLGGQLDALTSYLLDRGLFHDARVVAEFRRDPLRRAVSGRDIAQDAGAFLAGRLFTPVVAGTHAVVLEFLTLETGLAPVLTWQIPGDRKPRTQRLEAPHLDVFELRDRIVNKLQGWVRGRPGDPFDMPQWRALCAWLRESIGKTLPSPGHLVVIESEGLEGMPFHVAVAPEWTCSYASSWMSLAAAVTSTTRAAERLSVAMVTAFADDPKVATAMHHAGASLRALAGRAGLAYDDAIGAACDRTSVTALLAASDIGFIACHGLLQEDRKEVAWVLAHMGGYPANWVPSWTGTRTVPTI